MSNTQTHTRPDRWPIWAVLAAMAVLSIGGGMIGVAMHENDLAGSVAGSAVGFGLGMLLFAFVKNRESKLKRAAGACGSATPAASKFGAAMGVWMAVYCFDIALISWVLDIQAWPIWARAIAALSPAIPIGGVILALMDYVKSEPDEYQRLLITRALLIATGLTFFVLTAWGFIELYIETAPRFPVAFAMTPFWLFFGVANWWVRRGS